MFFETVKSKVIISLFETVRLSVSISLRNLYNSLKSIKETCIFHGLLTLSVIFLLLHLDLLLITGKSSKESQKIGCLRQMTP